MIARVINVKAATPNERRISKASFFLLLFIILKNILFNMNTIGQISGSSIFINFLMIIIMYFGLLIIFKRRTFWFWIIIDVIMSFIFVSNAIFYREYSDFITIALVAQVNQVSEIKGSIFALLKWTDFLYLVDLPFYIFFSIKYKSVIEIQRKKALASFVTAVTIIIICFITANYFYPGLFNEEFNRQAQVKRMGILAMYNIQGYSYLKDNVNTKPISQEETAQIEEQLKSEGYNNMGNYKGKNLIMIQVESLQRFVINEKYKGKEITPNINKLIKESAYFENCYQQIGMGHTADAELLTNTSLYPASDSCVYITKYNNSFISIANSLKEKSYRTLYFHGNDGLFWNRSLIYKNLGFDEFHNLDEFKKDEIIWGLSDGSFFRQSFDIIKDIKEPFYGFFVTMSSHSPFEITINDFTDGETYVEKYFNAINYADKAIGQFIDKLQVSGMLDNSILIVYGDHNALSTEDIGVYFNKNIESPYEKESYNKIPMIIRFPDKKYSGIYSKSVGQNDVLPTVRSILGIEDNKSFGRNMFDEGDNLVVLRNGSYVCSDTYYDSENRITYNINTGEVLPNNEVNIQKVFEKLEASDNILKYDYFNKVN